MKRYNPFTRSLAGASTDTALKAFIEDWDALEALVIRVYRGARATDADQAEWEALRPALGAAYPAQQAALNPLWHAARAAGAPTSEDPFLYLLSFERAADFVGRRRAMQFLPAAREAINRLLLDQPQS